MPRRPGTPHPSASEAQFSRTTEEGRSEPPTDEERIDDLADEQEEESGSNQDDAEEEAEPDEEEEEGPIVNPSTDITGDLKRILEKNTFKLNGSFYASKCYDNAPNPSLNVEGLGVVGLPLSASVAKRVISKCKQAPFGRGERTIVDRSVRDTWELDATKVEFESPAWKNWMTRTVVPHICESLGVDMAIAKPRAELYKLLVYEKGSHFLPHQDTEKTPGMFATIIVILPSKFTGGSLKLTHARESTLIDASTNSTFATHVVAWYTDVYHSVQPVQSGYRLALSYNLIHTNAPSLKPSLAHRSLEAQELRHVLLSWKQSFNPTQVVYLLDHMYSEHNLSTAALKGKDALRVRHLRAVAEELRFRICLVSVELHQSGQALDHDGYYDDYDPYSEDPDEVPPSMELAGVEEEEFKITAAFDLEGNDVEINEELSLDDRDCIPYPLSRTKPDEHEYEGYQGNQGGNMDLWYRRTALLIWPAKWDSEVVVWNYVQYAQDYLGVPEFTKPTKNEREVVNELIDWLEENVGEDGADDVLEIITNAAVRWNDPDIWIDACRAARMEEGLGEQMNASRIANDVGILGFEAIAEFLTDFMTECDEDDDRTDLLAALDDLEENKKGKELKAWLRRHREPDLQFQPMTQSNQITIEALIKKAQRRGESYLQEVMIPDIKSWNPHRNFLFSLVTALRRQSQDLASISPETLDSVCKDLTSFALSCTNVFPKSKSVVEGQEKIGPDIPIWIQNFEFAEQIERQLIELFCQRMEDHLQTLPTPKQNWLARNFFPAAVNRLDSWARSIDPPILPGDPLLRPFWRGTWNLYQKFARYSQKSIILALHWWGDFKGVKNEFIQLLEGLCATNIVIVQYFAKHAYLLRQKLTDETEVISAGAILMTITETLAVHCSLGHQPPDLERVQSVLHTLIHYDNGAPLHTLLDRLLQYASEHANSEEIVYGCLLSLMQGSISLHRGLKRAWPSEPLSDFAVNSIMRAVQLCSLDLGCSCAECKGLEAFASDDRTELSITAVQFTRTHVEKQIQTKAASWGFVWTTIKGKTPYTLRITKSPRTSNEGSNGRVNRILIALNSLGSILVQSQVLGNYWSSVCKAVKVNPFISERHATNVWKVARTDPNPTVEQPLPNPAAQRTNPDIPSASNIAPTATDSAQSSKRPYDQAMGNQGAGTSAQGAKRSKPFKAPMDIIELSDSD